MQTLEAGVNAEDPNTEVSKLKEQLKKKDFDMKGALNEKDIDLKNLQMKIDRLLKSKGDTINFEPVATKRK